MFNLFNHHHFCCINCLCATLFSSFRKLEYISAGDDKTYLDSSYRRLRVRGSGLSVFGIQDDSEIIVRNLSDEEKFLIEHKPVVLLKESGAYYYENDNTSFRKFVAYIDICPDTASSYSKDVSEHISDTSTFMLPHPHDIDPTGFSNFYTLNHSILKGINRMGFIHLCTEALKKVIRDQSASSFDFHKMSIICSCYGNVMNYQIVPTESIIANAEFILSDE